MSFRLPPLPWEKSEVKTFLSAHQIEDHYIHHHKVYVDTLNKLIEGTPLRRSSLEEILTLTGNKSRGEIFQNAAQHWAHTLYWSSFGPESEPPTGTDEMPLSPGVQGVIDQYENFTEQANKMFGSGYVAITKEDDGRIDTCCLHNVKYCPNALILIDMWEHSWYIDLEYRKSEYVSKFWNHINWTFVREQLEARS